MLLKKLMKIYLKNYTFDKTNNVTKLNISKKFFIWK